MFKVHVLVLIRGQINFELHDLQIYIKTTNIIIIKRVYMQSFHVNAEISGNTGN